MSANRTSGRRNRVENAARTLFLKHGYHGTSIADIAGNLGVSKAATAYYFPAKDDFPQAIVTPFLDDLETRVNTAPRGQTAPTTESAIAGYLDSIIEHHPVATWLDRDPYLLSHDDFGARLDAINKAVIGRMIGPRPTVARRLIAQAALGGIWRPARENTAANLRRYRTIILGTALATATT